MDIEGSINFTRKQCFNLVVAIAAREIKQMVLAQRDCLARLGSALLVHVNQCLMSVMDTKLLSPEQAFVQDLITITQCFPVGCTACTTIAMS
jgi:predicted site-specific integrase-resolvase